MLAGPRPLVFPLKNPLAVTAITSGEGPECLVPAFPGDSDEKVTVLFRLSLNEFVMLASAIDVGSDIAYGQDALQVWWVWVASLMCASFCEEMAECIEGQQESLMAALAGAIKSNPLLLAAIADAVAENGGIVPGRPLSEGQAGTNVLPANVKIDDECDFNALWGACLYLIQSGNRAITDFFEQIEDTSNTLETSSLVADKIPAAGDYVSFAFELADQLRENIAEGYAAEYTEEYENDLACALFCAAKTACELTPDMLTQVLNERLPDPGEYSNFGPILSGYPHPERCIIQARSFRHVLAKHALCRVPIPDFGRSRRSDST